ECPDGQLWLVWAALAGCKVAARKLPEREAFDKRFQLETISSHMMNRLLDRPGLVFTLVLIWKIALLAFTVQPIPANDSFFYDGPVVHVLNQGGYFNPSIAIARPISGTEVFSAYPPAYQVVLLAWMSVFGTSALSADWLHLVLFGGYLFVVLAI